MLFLDWLLSSQCVFCSKLEVVSFFPCILLSLLSLFLHPVSFLSLLFFLLFFLYSRKRSDKSEIRHDNFSERHNICVEDAVVVVKLVFVVVSCFSHSLVMTLCLSLEQCFCCCLFLFRSLVYLRAVSVKEALDAHDVSYTRNRFRAFVFMSCELFSLLCLLSSVLCFSKVIKQ